MYPPMDGTLAPPCEYDWTCAASAHLNLQSKQQISHSAIFAQLTAECHQACPGMSFPLIIAPSHGGSGPHLIHASLGPPKSIIQKASQSFQPLFAQLMAEHLYTSQWATLSPSKLPLSMGRSTPPSCTWFLGLIRAHNPNGISIGSAVFGQLSAGCHYTLQWATPSPLKIAPSHGDLDPHLIRGSLGPKSRQPKWHLDRLSRFFAELISVTDRLTDHTTRSVMIGCIYIRSTAM